jgi:hypothetical protein
VAKPLSLTAVAAGAQIVVEPGSHLTPKRKNSPMPFIQPLAASH